jgi:Cu(I)/Ag(I) efflux system membrane protein CusA/SilA
MIGGMISSTLLTLIVIPAIFAVVKRFGLKVTEPGRGMAQASAGSGQH